MCLCRRPAAQAPTDANAQSSRSHAVLQVYVTHRERGEGLRRAVVTSKLSLIDLAGSERASVRRATRCCAVPPSPVSPFCAQDGTAGW